LQEAIHDLDQSNVEQKAINEAALSVNEEYQSMNEELLTSKEELQSLNEELTVLNNQLQETLDRQRTTSNDLQNVMFSTDIATVFLDTSLNIRFFTPATKSLFNIIPSDVGRPLADLNSLVADGALLRDAGTVLRSLAPIDREIEAQNGAWYMRRILPYRTQDNGVGGVVITFADITDRRHAADALETSKRAAQAANAAKSRFLAAASHDLRQPLQTLSLMRGVLIKKIKEHKNEEALELVERLDGTAAAMSGMLDTLLDINQPEAGTVQAEPVSFPISGLLDRLKDEFTYYAEAKKLELRVVSSGLSVYSDPRLLEQMIRNLLSNALKYTKRGKVLLGCRRSAGILSIEVWDTGIGIPQQELQAIFEEYHQLDNAAHDRGHGLGLGLSIVQRLGNLLDHRVRVRSRPGNGSVFTIDVALSVSRAAQLIGDRQQVKVAEIAKDAHRTGTILVIEDDPELRDLVELLLNEDGHRTATAPDGISALELMAQEMIQPDLILADYNLPNGMNGLEIAAKLRAKLHRQVPVIILTGDISTSTLLNIAHQDCVQLNKPVKAAEVMQVIQRLLPLSQAAPDPRTSLDSKAAYTADSPVIFIVDDDDHLRDGVRNLLETKGWIVEDHATCETFLETYRPGHEACLLIDAYLPGMNGLELLRRLREAGHKLPAIMITGNSDVPMAVQAMKAGASDFIEKPIGRDELIASIEHALAHMRDSGKLSAWQKSAANHIAGLTPQQRKIMGLVLTGLSSKDIASDIGISQRRVESHRAEIMKRTGTKSLPALARLAFAANWSSNEEPFAQG